MKKLMHRISHFFGWNNGEPFSYYDTNGRLVMCFKCECGEKTGHHFIDGLIDKIIKEKNEV